MKKMMKTVTFTVVIKATGIMHKIAKKIKNHLVLKQVSTNGDIHFDNSYKIQEIKLLI